MSYSHDIASYIISLNYKVGIDIELHNNTLNIQEFADLIFTPSEYKFFSTLEDEERVNFFYNTWTKKESIIKASGQGLSYPVNSIETIALSSSEKIFPNNENNKFKQAWYCIRSI